MLFPIATKKKATRKAVRVSWDLSGSVHQGKSLRRFSGLNCHVLPEVWRQWCIATQWNCALQAPGLRSSAWLRFSCQSWLDEKGNYGIYFLHSPPSCRVLRHPSRRASNIKLLNGVSTNLSKCVCYKYLQIHWEHSSLTDSCRQTKVTREPLYFWT